VGSTHHPLFNFQPTGGSRYPFAILQDNVVLHKMLSYLSAKRFNFSQLTEWYSSLLDVPILDSDHLGLYFSQVAIAAKYM